MKSKRIKIAYILTPITFGGAEKVSLNFLKHVDRERFDIMPILLTRPWEEAPYFAQEIHQLGYDYESIPVALKPRSNGREPLRVPRVACLLYFILKNSYFDLVHTHGYFADICGLPVARMLGVRTISTCHGFVDTDRKLKIYNRLNIYFLRLCQRIIAVSDGIKNDLIQGGIKDSKIVVIPNAVPPSLCADELLTNRHKKRLSLGFTPDEFVVGYLGRLSQEKGLNYLIQAIKDLRDDSAPVKLLIVGDGPERKTLEEMVKDNQLGPFVFFAGFQTNTGSWFSTLDVFVLPSMTEGTPMALLEAMAFSVPVIATAVGGVPKVMTGYENGLLIPPGNHQAISDKLNLIMNNSELKERLATAGADTIKKKYSIEKWCKDIESLYL